MWHSKGENDGNVESDVDDDDDDDDYRDDGNANKELAIRTSYI